jgi:hypothetical protein
VGNGAQIERVLLCFVENDLVILCWTKTEAEAASGAPQGSASSFGPRVAGAPASCSPVGKWPNTRAVVSLSVWADIGYT